MSAGDLRKRFTFSSRISVDDGLGNMQGGWATQFTVWAQRIDLRGGESVMAARLEGRAPTILIVRSTAQTRTITTDWQAIDDTTGDTYNVRSVSMRQQNDYLDILAEKGVSV